MSLNAAKCATSANAYATVSEADSFLEMVYGCEEWASVDDDAKERLLVTASMSIDEMPVKYPKAASTQAMKFPLTIKSWFYDGFTEGEDGFDDVKKAAIWQAFYLFENHDSIREAIANSIQGVKQESLSSISKASSGFNPMKRWSPKALSLMSRYTDFSTKHHRYRLPQYFDDNAR